MQSTPTQGSYSEYDERMSHQTNMDQWRESNRLSSLDSQRDAQPRATELKIMATDRVRPEFKRHYRGRIRVCIYAYITRLYTEIIRLTRLQCLFFFFF